VEADGLSTSHFKGISLQGSESFSAPKDRGRSTGTLQMAIRGHDWVAGTHASRLELTAMTESHGDGEDAS